MQHKRILGVGRSAVEFCGKHPFATGLFALLGIAGLGFSMYGFSLDREDAIVTGNQISDGVEITVNALDPDRQDSLLNDPIEIDFGNAGDTIDTIIFRTSDRVFPAGTKFDDDQKSALLNLYGEEYTYSSTPFINFSISSKADKHFVQIAPYIIIDVNKVQDLDFDISAAYLGERGGGAILREFYGTVMPIRGTQIAPLDQSGYTTKIDFMTLEPGEVEEFHVELDFMPEVAVSFRLGIQVKFKGDQQVIWTDRVFHRANTIREIPLVTWGSSEFEVRPYPDGEYADVDLLRSRYSDQLNIYKSSRVFHLGQVELEPIEITD